jgi:hypothetical protein
MRRARVLPWLLGSVIVLGPVFAGCGEEKKTEMIVPEKSDVDQAKASIEFSKKRLAEEAAAKKR